MDFIKNLFQKVFVRRLALLAVIALLLYLMRSLITLFLLTFIFIYLFNAAQKAISRVLGRFVKIKAPVIVITLYLLLLAGIVLAVYLNAQKISDQVMDIVNAIISYVETGSGKPLNTNIPLINELAGYLKNFDITPYMEDIRSYITGLLKNIGSLGFDCLMSLILSLFFMLEKRRILGFFRKFETSHLGRFYGDARYFLLKFTDSFGKVIETQILISFINSILSTIILSILRFPNLFGLWAMILVLGLVPVAGVFLSLIPLSIIAYNLGGFRYVVYILLLIALLHSLESYVLNPKLMSQKTKLPVFVTFLILIISEHFFGVWGLIIGIPLAVFLLDLLGVKTPQS